ncbi:MAG: flagellar hook-length control protein FliK [Candidatus Latescibacterota bacterium]|nr:flagellar hook-length control protein FliK [Candidatus Latescibacterota bacterium]
MTQALDLAPPARTEIGSSDRAFSVDRGLVDLGEEFEDSSFALMLKQKKQQQQQQQQTQRHRPEDPSSRPEVAATTRRGAKDEEEEISVTDQGVADDEDAAESGAAIVQIAEALPGFEMSSAEDEIGEKASSDQTALWRLAANSAAAEAEGGTPAFGQASSSSAIAPVLGPETAGVPAVDGTAPTALDLLNGQELMDPDLHVDTEGNIIERIQQAVNNGSAASLDELGEPVVPQIVRNVAALARNGVSEMRLQLQPGDLGEIELRVRAMEGTVRGEVMVQTPEVKYLLESQLNRLRAALAEHGLQLDGFDVSVGDDGRSQEQLANGEGGGGQRSRERASPDALGRDDPTLDNPRRVRLGPGVVDYVI